MANKKEPNVKKYPYDMATYSIPSETQKRLEVLAHTINVSKSQLIDMAANVMLDVVQIKNLDLPVHQKGCKKPSRGEVAKQVHDIYRESVIKE